MQTTALDPGASALQDQSGNDAGDALLVEAAAEEELLDEFYAFMYESAVLVTGGASSPSKDTVRSADTVETAKPPSPRRGGEGSPRKNMISGPTAASLGTSATPAAPLLTRELMNAMLPPKSWSDASGKWQRMVRLTQATRGQVLQLEDAFDALLDSRQARATAICHVREKFFLQVFEEMIREVACECPERGLLLLRARDELRLSIEAYQTLYHNSIAYGRKKAVQAEAGIADLEAEIQRLEAQREQLQAEKNARTHRELLLDGQLDDERRKRLSQQEQTRQFLQTQRQELEVFYRELMQDTNWK